MKFRTYIEKLIDFVAAIAVFLVHFCAFPAAYPARSDELFSNVVNISGIAIGFLTAGQALLCGLEDNWVVKVLKKWDRLGQMLGFFSTAIYWCLALVVFSLLSHAIDFKSHPAIFSTWLAVLAGAGVATVRVLCFFDRILKRD